MVIILIMIVLFPINTQAYFEEYENDGGNYLTREQKLDKLIENSKKELGTKYVYGATGPDTYDCSGFTQAMYKSVGVNLSRVSQDQSKNGEHVDRDDLQRGDLMFFKTTAREIGHVGIYLGDNTFIHASSGGKKVMTSSIDQDYYKKRYVTARRVIDGTDVEYSTEGGGSEAELAFDYEEIESIKDLTSGTGIYNEQTDGEIVLNYKIYRFVKNTIKMINWVVHIMAYFMIVLIGMLWAMYALALSGIGIVNKILIRYTGLDVYREGTMQQMLKITIVSLILIAMILMGVILVILEKIVIRIMQIRI